MVYEGKFISYIAAKWNIEPGLFLWWEEKILQVKNERFICNISNKSWKGPNSHTRDLISQKVNKIGNWYCQNKNDIVKTINVA